MMFSIFIYQISISTFVHFFSSNDKWQINWIFFFEIPSLKIVDFNFDYKFIISLHFSFKTALNESLIRSSFSSFSSQDSRAPINVKRSFYVNSSISRINGNSYHGLPFQQKSFKKQKPMINNNSTTKQIISGCNLVESIMEG